VRTLACGLFAEPCWSSIPLVARGELNRWWRVGLIIVTPLLRLVLRIRVYGLEHVPLSGPALLAFNHASALDGPVLAIETARRIKRECRFLVAAEFFEKPFFGWVLHRYDQIPIRRGEGDHAALDEALATIKGGSLLAISPEGTVNPDPSTLMRVRAGAARIAMPTGAPVIPVGVWGTQKRWPKSGIVWGSPFRPTVAIVFGEPLLPGGDPDRPEDIDEFSERLGTHLERQVQRARAVSGDPE